MTLIEFKSWFQGFAAGIGEKPTLEQWEMIKAQVALLNSGPTFRNDQMTRRAIKESAP